MGRSKITQHIPTCSHNMYLPIRVIDNVSITRELQEQHYAFVAEYTTWSKRGNICFLFVPSLTFPVLLFLGSRFFRFRFFGLRAFLLLAFLRLGRFRLQGLGFLSSFLLFSRSSFSRLSFLLSHLDRNITGWNACTLRNKVHRVLNCAQASRSSKAVPFDPGRLSKARTTYSIQLWSIPFTTTGGCEQQQTYKPGKMNEKR